ncbi:MAG: hypothetical protein ACRECY_18700 [Phyllobacterium sp.]
MKRWFIAEWQERHAIRTYRRRIRKIEDEYALKAGTASGPRAERDQWERSAYDRVQTYIDRIERVKTEALMRSARNHGVSLPPPGDDSAYWERSRTPGFWLLTFEGQTFVRSRIPVGDASVFQSWVSWIAIGAGVLGFAYICIE